MQKYGSGKKLPYLHWYWYHTLYNIPCCSTFRMTAQACTYWQVNDSWCRRCPCSTIKICIHIYKQWKYKFLLFSPPRFLLHFQLHSCYLCLAKVPSFIQWCGTKMARCEEKLLIPELPLVEFVYSLIFLLISLIAYSIVSFQLEGAGNLLRKFGEWESECLHNNQQRHLLYYLKEYFHPTNYIFLCYVYALVSSVSLSCYG